MKSLKRIVGEMVLATACGAAIGASAGYSVEAGREARHEERKMSGEYAARGHYEMNRGRIVGTGMLGAVVGFAVYVLKREKRKEGDGTNDLDEE